MKITLYYFKIPFWRAEVTRLSLYIGDIPFEDYRIEGNDYDKFKKTGELPNKKIAPFKQLPVLDVDGKILPKLVQLLDFVVSYQGCTQKMMIIKPL